MTGPRTPGEAITQSAQRIAAQRDATKALSEQIAADRAKAQQPEPEPAEGGPEQP